ncbi:heme-binding protein 2-like [Amphiura filiformis]|uniref:heme-binding protein 2-like n=1 Tax=Amphiura filiformis TaxID=82378 RepID=UPI003B21C51A
MGEHGNDRHEQRQGFKEGFNRLFNYISGDNEAGQKIDMTAPVLMKVTDNSDMMTVSFFIPFEHQDSPPAPSAENVFIKEVPEHEVYVRSFSGYADQDDYSREAQALAASLQQASSSFEEGVYFTAGYDAPFKPVNRHNEVWYKKA